MNSDEEVNTVSNLVQQNSSCSGEAGIGGSTNEATETEFSFSNLYSQNTSLRK